MLLKANNQVPTQNLGNSLSQALFFEMGIMPAWLMLWKKLNTSRFNCKIYRHLITVQSGFTGWHAHGSNVIGGNCGPQLMI